MSPEPIPEQPSVIVVTGVSGAGKSTVSPGDLGRSAASEAVCRSSLRASR